VCVSMSQILKKDCLASKKMPAGVSDDLHVIQEFTLHYFQRTGSVYTAKKCKLLVMCFAFCQALRHVKIKIALLSKAP
jgi:hypothetical protein